MDKCKVCGVDFQNPSLGGPGICPACDCGIPPHRRKIIEGTWLPDDLRRAFVNGAQWWEYHSTGATMWGSDRALAEEEAEKRFPDGKLPIATITAQQLEDFDKAQRAADQ